MTRIAGLFLLTSILGFGDVTGPIVGIDEGTGQKLVVETTGNNGSTTFVVYAADSKGAVISLSYTVNSQTFSMDGYLLYQGQTYYMGKTLAEDLLLTAKLTHQ